ncbi:MAG: carbamoyltransferase HypF, partial [Gelidibacter sp.]|nr:carbamoyltransferase HypF [Gelidibacter sp.]
MQTYKISISGQVQGVGFRPFVYGLAKSLSLTGTVSNNEEGVIIYISGFETTIRNFYKKLIENPPPVSKIKSPKITQIDFLEFADFNIIPSNKNGQLNLSLTPDFAICDDCKKDIQNPENRRFNYPFATCVNCGPRWAITRTFPFERNHTSIHDFPMCAECEKEYSNPADRRFHSQTNTCPTCGIELILSDNLGNIVPSTPQN